jgi:hypothetical protein
VQDEPGLRTFYATNAYDLDDRQGEGKKLWAATSGKGMNLYGFCDSGVALIITDKRIVSDLNADELMLAATGDDAYIGGEYWLSKSVGMFDEMYRAAAERENAIYFPNNESIWMFFDDQLKDIGNLGYHYRIRRNYLDNILPGYRTRIMAVYDVRHNEVWFGIRGNCAEIVLNDQNPGFNNYYPAPISGAYAVTVVVVGSNRPDNQAIQLPAASAFPEQDRICIYNTTEDTFTAFYPVGLIIQQFDIEPGEMFCFTRSEEVAYAAYIATETAPGCERELLVYAPKNEGWVGRYTYSFDRYLCIGNRTFGFRDAETYELHIGSEVNGDTIECSAETVFNPQSNADKEFTRIRAASDLKPTAIEFMETLDGPVVARMDAATFGQFYLKDYHGWEHLIPRKSVAPFNRMQGRRLIARVVYQGEEAFLLSSLECEYKLLK